ncbi:MAG: hypothetical protein HRT82_16410 [Henriciella sp.]|nr:hypothetical protein [Henriciella sp.]
MPNKTLVTMTAIALSLGLSACSGGGGGGGMATPTSSSPPPPPPPPPSAPPPPPSGSVSFDVTRLGILDGASGSSRQEMSRSVAFDSSGDMYIAGGFGSSDFPFPDPNTYDTSFQSSGGTSLGNQGPLDAFVAKFDSTGQLEWTTAFGGPNYERAYAIEVDETGPNPGIIIVGRAGDGLPTTADALQTSFAGDNRRNGAYGDQDGFVAKFSLDGRNLLWATYIGGVGPGFVRSLDVDSQGRAHIGFIALESFPYITGNAIRSSRQGTSDAVYAVLSEDGSSIEYATYLGGTSTGFIEPISALKVIENNGAYAGTYITFYDNGPDAPTTAGAYQPNIGGNTDMVVAKIDSGFGLEWMTYLGGSEDELLETHTLAIDSQGRPVIAGFTWSQDFPTSNNAHQTSLAGGSDGFISILSADGRSLVASSYFGGSGNDEFEGLDVLNDGTIAVTGFSFSTNLPVNSESFQAFHGGAQDGILVRWAADLGSLLYFTYLGGTGNDRLADVDANASNVLGIVGAAGSTPFPTVGTNDSATDGQFGAIYGRLEPN